MTRLTFFCNHKCGSSWFYKLLKDFSHHNNLSFISTNRGWKSFSSEELPPRSLCFYRNSQYQNISADCQTGIRIIRNPLAIVISAYFSHLNSHNLGDWSQLKKQRLVLSQINKKMGIALTLAFLEKSDFYFNSCGPLNAFDNWHFDDKRFVTLRMEDFVLNPNEYLRRSIVAMGYDPEHFTFIDENKFTFEALSGREIGDVLENEHYRSGSPDDWHKHMPVEVEMYIKSHYGELLRQFYPEVL